jgi:hypothetical protein
LREEKDMNIAKAIAAALVPLAGSLVIWWSSGEYDAGVVGAQLIALVTAISVYIVPNKPPNA